MQQHPIQRRVNPNRFPIWFRWAVAALVIAVLILPDGSASAHANLVRSDPPQGASLAQSPKEIVLEYTEELDPGFTTVELLDLNARVVASGPGTVDTANRKVLRLALPALPDGVYSALWRARSVVDGHVTTGTVGFSVGVATPRVSLLPLPGAPDPATALPDFADSLTRWLSYLAVAVMLGSMLFGLLIWRPLLPGSADAAQPDGFANGLLPRLTLWGAGGLVAATLGSAIVQAGQASGAGFPAMLGAPLAAYAVTRSGLLLIIRLGVVIVIGALTWRLRSAPGTRGGLRWAAALLGAGLLITFSLQSHAAALNQPLAVMADTLHLLAMAAWVGGLLPLTLALVDSRKRGPDSALPEVKALVSRFSLLALISVDVLAATGLYSAILQAQTLDALLATTYGRTLIIKVGLVALLMALGAVNLRIITPRLAASGSAASWLRRTTRVELSIGLLVIAAAGVLTGVAPAFTALEAQRRLGFMRSDQLAGVSVVLRVAPAALGDNEFGVDVLDSRPGASGAPATVALDLFMADRNVGVTRVDAAAVTGGRYSARGNYLTLPGNWRIEVFVKRPGFDDVVFTFALSISGNTTGSALEPDIPNPVRADAGSIAAGTALYAANCQPCHGASGRGDGPVGLTLNPRPADLTKHTVPGVHTDGQLWLWISNGYPGSVMPAFAKYLNDTDRWNLVNYIRTFARSK